MNRSAHLLLATSLVALTFFAASLPAATVSGTFKDNASNETGFRIERAAATGAFAQVGANLPAKAGSGSLVAWSDSVPTPATGSITYRYRALAFNSAGLSTPSNVLTVPVDAPEVPPAGPSEMILTELVVTVDAAGNVKTVATLAIEGQDAKTATLEGKIELQSAPPAPGPRWPRPWEWLIPSRHDTAAALAKPAPAQR